METDLIKSIVLGTEASASAQKNYTSPLRVKNPMNGVRLAEKPHLSPYRDTQTYLSPGLAY